MKNKMMLWITLLLISIMLASCSLVGSKAGSVKCTGTSKNVGETPGKSEVVNGASRTEGLIIEFELVSDCPELTGVMKVTANYFYDAQLAWGTFYIETAYQGGGRIEGTTNYTRSSDSTAVMSCTSFDSVSSLRGLKLDLTANVPAGAGYLSEVPFEATIQNAPQE
jgi:hypothetical protein